MLSRTEKTWKNTIQFKPKLRTYVKYKIDYKTEDYIRIRLGSIHRAILAEFRSGILPLRIETGRWKNENIEERVCLVCKENIVEDEYHSLCICKRYDDVRQV